MWPGQLPRKAVPALGVNCKSHILPGHPRVTEIVAVWGGFLMRIRLGWQPQHTKGRRTKQEGDGCLKGEEVAEHKEGEKLSGNEVY